MNKSFLIVLTSLAVLFSQTSEADSTIPSNVKHWNIGVGSYATTVNIDGSYYEEDIEFSGFNLVGSYAFTDSFAIRGGYFSLENDDDSSLESSGIDLVAYYGTGLASIGFKAYVGGGFYSDTWSVGSEEEDFSGLQLNGGIGYSWEPVSIDLVLGVRSADDYADFIEDIGGEGEVVAVSLALQVSARF